MHDKKTLATQYCEGSKTLRKTLLAMWKAGIETRACCSGIPKRHRQYKETSNPYLSFDITSPTKEIIYKFLNKLKENGFEKIIG